MDFSWMAHRTLTCNTSGTKPIISIPTCHSSSPGWKPQPHQLPKSQTWESHLTLPFLLYLNQGSIRFGCPSSSVSLTSVHFSPFPHETPLVSSLSSLTWITATPYSCHLLVRAPDPTPNAWGMMSYPRSLAQHLTHNRCSISGHLGSRFQPLEKEKENLK